jgi:hypothetical protein
MPRELSRQEFDAIAARVAQSAPAGLSRQEFDDLIAGEALKASGYEAPLTRERQAPGAPSAMGAKHHPGTLAGSREGDALRAIEDWETPTDAAFLKRGPEVGGAAGMMLGGPLGAGVGAAAGSLVKGQAERGAHMPTGGEAGQAALDGGFSALLAGAPGALVKGARTIGPAVAKHAGAVSKGLSALSGLGAGVVSGNPLTGMGVGTATKMLTSPSGLRAAGTLAGRVGAAIPEHVANKVGFGALSADAYRTALLEALGAGPASTVP